MRAAFIECLESLAVRDRRIVILTGDLGFALMEPMAARLGERFLNVGVAEQNMIGMATGLAEGGRLPFVYSIGTFAALRPFEFIRNGPVAQRLPVRIVAAGGGFDYGTAGATHHNLEDIALMRTQHGLLTVVPADAAQARAALLRTWDADAPVYYRVAKDDNGVVPGLDGRFELGKLDIIREGSDLAFVALGPMAIACHQAAEHLATAGLSATVAVVSCVNPPPTADLIAVLRRHDLIISAEAHVVNGGLGSLVAEAIAEAGLGCRLLRCGVESHPTSAGTKAYLDHAAGLTAQQLTSRARAFVTQSAGRS